MGIETCLIIIFANGKFGSESRTSGIRTAGGSRWRVIHAIPAEGLLPVCEAAQGDSGITSSRRHASGNQGSLLGRGIHCQSQGRGK